MLKAKLVLQDYLNRHWQNEYVQFRLSDEEFAAARRGEGLAGSDGRAIPYQLIEAPGSPPEIGFVTDLEPFETREYTFTGTREASASDLSVEEDAARIRIINGKTAISIRKNPRPGEGPLEGVRLGSGQWVGDSVTTNGGAMAYYKATLVSSGPVYAEVVCEGQTDEGAAWELVVRLRSGETVAFVSEKTDGTPPWEWVFEKPAPTHLLYRMNTGLETIPVAPHEKPLFHLLPWTPWWQKAAAKWFCADFGEASDVLLVAARDGERWVMPGDAAAERGNASLWKAAIVVASDSPERVVLSFPKHLGERHWMVGPLDRQESFSLLGKKPLEPSLPHRKVIQYEFPLNRIKDYILEWPEQEEHPRMLVTPGGIDRLKKHFQADPKKIARWVQRKKKAAQPGESQFFNFLVSGDPALEANLIESLVGEMQSMTDQYFRQPLKSYALGVGPHFNRSPLTAPVFADLLLSSPSMSPEIRRRIRAQAAFVGYTVSRADYWDPERGFRANPNMSTLVAGYQVAAGALLSSHPLSRQWMEKGLKELKTQLEEWSDEGGGWLESPHYAMVSYDLLTGCLLMARNSGHDELVFHPRMKKVMEWFAKISTPPDSRLSGWRHLPLMGDTYFGESSGMFGVAASIWSERDPEFASQMQWMYQQHGERDKPLIGGPHAGTERMFGMLTNPDIEARAPVYGSELFPQTCVLLRSNGYPSDRETMLTLKVGRHMEHYGPESGHFLLWGKGRVIADGWGYVKRPVRLLNVVDTPAARGKAMRVEAFSTQEPLDYVSGKLNGWRRQIAFIKDAAPEGGNYFLLCDTLDEALTAQPVWRLWFTAEAITATAPSVHVAGFEDVDTDLHFLQPSPVELKTEVGEVEASFGIWPDGKHGQRTHSQTGLSATGQGARVFTVVIAPRLKTEAAIEVTPLAENRGARIETPAGVDYVFLSATPFHYEEGDVLFEGTCGSIQLREGRRNLSLGAAGKIGWKGDMLESDKAATRNGKE